MGIEWSKGTIRPYLPRSHPSAAKMREATVVGVLTVARFGRSSRVARRTSIRFENRLGARVRRRALTFCAWKAEKSFPERWERGKTATKRGSMGGAEGRRREEKAEEPAEEEAGRRRAALAARAGWREGKKRGNE
ncbi:hypothetical protein KM043_000819 [Ampulex compressa]|nr:hypothetical protein KM043_000819 [Ampulex compressa]